MTVFHEELRYECDGRRRCQGNVAAVNLIALQLRSPSLSHLVWLVVTVTLIAERFGDFCFLQQFGENISSYLKISSISSRLPHLIQMYRNDSA